MEVAKRGYGERPQVQKLWGQEDWVVNNEFYCGKVLYLRPGFQCSLHYHPVKNESFMVIQGKVGVEVRDGELAEMVILDAKSQDVLDIPAGVAHRFWAIGEEALLVEFSTPHSDEDVVRLEESKLCE